jgi:hypothetical protein
MAGLLLGPLLRYVGRTTATVWVEADAACDVAVLGQSARTFEVSGHHYALVPLEDLPEGAVLEYEVHLDGERVWPLPGSTHPPSTIHTREGEDRARLVFGSCRVGAPQREPYTLPPGEEHGFGVDALWAYSRRLQEGIEPWPDGLLLCGDQVYADEVSPETLEYIRSRRDTSQPPGEEIADFEEYTRLYREAWSDPDIRWLFSTVASLMVFDDHDVIDDWNISWQWLEDIRSEPWWRSRITGAYMAYWVYQHLGNLAPPELDEDEVYRLAMSADGADIGPELERFAERADRESASTRWASRRDFGRSRVLVVDSRAARVLDDGHRDMVDEEEWAWIADRSHEAVDHLVIVSTLPVFLAPGVHYLEAWNEAVCAGAWGRPAAWLGERLRRSFDLEHWPAFQESFTGMVDLLRDVATGSRSGRPPASITLVGGDVHNAYIAEVSLGRRDASRSRVHQLVCSPFRNPLSPMQRRLVGLMSTRLAAGAMRRLARLAGVKPPTVRWRYRAGPTYHNSIGVVELDGRRAEATIYRSDEGEPSDSLRSLHTRVLAEGPRAGDG